MQKAKKGKKESGSGRLLSVGEKANSCGALVTICVCVSVGFKSAETGWRLCVNYIIYSVGAVLSVFGCFFPDIEYCKKRLQNRQM